MSDDPELQRRVIHELDAEPRIDATDIRVTVRDGVVTLSGHVDGDFEVFKAERAARRVKGVKAVTQQLVVERPDDWAETDEDIATRAATRLNATVAAPTDRFSIEVEHGVVTLSGVVDRPSQRIDLEITARKLPGVKGVLNNIVVQPSTALADRTAVVFAAMGRTVETAARDDAP